MSPLSKSVLLIGTLLLCHSCYSAYEHSSLIARLPRNSSSSSAAAPTLPSLPPDISAETVISVLLICIGLVLGAEKLQPISWRVWAGKAEKESGGGPFQGLENRIGFLDIRATRKEFAEWVKAEGKD